MRLQHSYLGNVSNPAPGHGWKGEAAPPSRGGISNLLGVLVAALLVCSLAVGLRDGGQPDHALSFAAPSGPAPDMTVAAVAAAARRARPPLGPSPLAALAQPVAPDGRPAVALTFDDGPDPRWTPTVLQILREEGVVAVFCTVGNMAKAHPDLVRAEAAGGHAACDHTLTHDEHLDRRPPPVIATEVNGQADTLREILGADPPYYRAPGGNLSPQMVETAHHRGMRVVQWSADVADFRHHSPHAMLASMLRQVRPGTIILLHDGGGDRSATVAMLRPLIQQLKGRGFAFVLP